MPDIETLAREKAGDEKAAYMAWLDAFSEGAYLQEDAHLGERAFRQIADACATPRQFSLLVEAFDEHAKEHPGAPNGFHLLAGFVDDSAHGLPEWIAAIEYFYDWLAQNKRSSPGLPPMLEYLACCAEAQAHLPHKESLPDVLSDMLDQYGYQS